MMKSACGSEVCVGLGELSTGVCHSFRVAVTRDLRTRTSRSTPASQGLASAASRRAVGGERWFAGDESNRAGRGNRKGARANTMLRTSVCLLAGAHLAAAQGSLAGDVVAL